MVKNKVYDVFCFMFAAGIDIFVQEFIHSSSIGTFISGSDPFEYQSWVRFHWARDFCFIVHVDFSCLHVFLIIICVEIKRYVQEGCFIDDATVITDYDVTDVEHVF